MQFWQFVGFRTDTDSERFGDNNKTKYRKIARYECLMQSYLAWSFGLIGAYLFLVSGSVWADCDSASFTVGPPNSSVICVDPPADATAVFDIATGTAVAPADALMCNGLFTTCAVPTALPGGGANGTYYFQRASDADDIWEGDWVNGVGFVAARVSTLPTPIPVLSPIALLLSVFALGSIGWWRLSRT